MGRHGLDCGGSGWGQVTGVCEWGKMRGNSWPADDLLASQERLCCMVLVSWLVC